MSLALDNSSDPSTPDEPPARILVVDDEDPIRANLREFLEMLGYSVAEAADGRQGMVAYFGQDPDVVITDVHMPAKSGIELLHEIRRQDAAASVIIITGKPSVDAAVDCIRGGAIDYISKPFDLLKLKDTVAAAVKQRRKLVAADPEGTVFNSFSHRQQAPAGYETVRALGQGNMGMIYLVQRIDDPRRRFAMKVLRQDIGVGQRQEAARQRFDHEVAAAAMVQHPNVVEIIDFGVMAGGQTPYVVMEYVNGKPLSFYIRHETLAPVQKAEILRQVARALVAIHQAGIYHRDIKPSNILMGTDFHPKLTDFGIARLPDSELTLAMSLVGTPAYMAPEAYGSAAAIDQQSDIFSLGVVAYELFTGTRPFEGSSIPALMHQVCRHQPPPPREVDPECPRRVQDLVMRMLAKAPPERPPSAEAVVAALDRFLGV